MWYHVYTHDGTDGMKWSRQNTCKHIWLSVSHQWLESAEMWLLCPCHC